MGKTNRRSVNLHVRITKAMYDELVRESGKSSAGETVSDLARAGMQREVDVRKKRRER